MDAVQQIPVPQDLSAQQDRPPIEHVIAESHVSVVSVWTQCSALQHQETPFLCAPHMKGWQHQPFFQGNPSTSWQTTCRPSVCIICRERREGKHILFVLVFIWFRVYYWNIFVWCWSKIKGLNESLCLSLLWVYSQCVNLYLVKLVFPCNTGHISSSNVISTRTPGEERCRYKSCKVIY